MNVSWQQLQRGVGAFYIHCHLIAWRQMFDAVNQQKIFGRKGTLHVDDDVTACDGQHDSDYSAFQPFCDGVKASLHNHGMDAHLDTWQRRTPLDSNMAL